MSKLTLAGLVALGIVTLPLAAQRLSARSDVPGIALRVAGAHGIGAWGSVVEISYTFNVEAGTRKSFRKWTWRPREGRVTYHGGSRIDTALTYTTADLHPDSPQILRDLDHAFINDQYWLVFPFHLVWDSDVTVTDEGTAPLPIGEGSARKIVARYGPTGGYTPGDVYEVFVDEHERIVQWRFLEGGDETEAHPMTFEDHRTFGGLRIPMEHRSSDGSFRLFFTDVRVELE
ncbi:MAG: hypothetical protein OEO21_11640 [Candidatus Krumholzibacteria bacterium]|nr:hypothetical protein [Candidatus Krumholzibacteria bacterium]